MKKFLVWTTLIFASASAQAMDHRSQFGLGGSLGGTFAAPWASQTFRDSVGPHIPALGVWGRYIPGTPEVGLELGYNYFDLAKQNIHTHTLILSFISRQNPWGNFHPFYGFGMGYSKSNNWYTTGSWEAPVFKIIAGIEYELNDRTDVGFQLDHYSIFKNQATEPNLHVLTPVLTATYYFGKPAPLPPANPTPVPVPVPAAAPAVAAPALVKPSYAPTPDDPRANTNAGRRAMTGKKKNTLIKRKKKKKTVPTPPVDSPAAE